MSGLDVLRRLRQDEEATADVVAVTAAKDVKTVRAAMQGGVVHYIVKPFLFETFRDRLERYAALKQRLERLREASQGEVDHLFSLPRVEGQVWLPKGISAPTLALVVAAARESETEVTAVDVAERAGISRGTARRYLEYLESLGSVELTSRYGATGPSPPAKTRQSTLPRRAFTSAPSQAKVSASPRDDDCYGRDVRPLRARPRQARRRR